MNIRQKQIICTALFLLALFVLFPPWVYKDSLTSVKKPAGYYFLFSPPEVKPEAEMRNQLSITDDLPILFYVRKDGVSLSAEILAVSFFAVGFILILADKKSFKKNAVGGTCIFVGCLFTVSVCLLNWR